LIVTDLDDRELWARMAGGDAQSLGELFDRHHRAVYNHCFRLTALWSTAEDLAAQVFIEAWRHRSKTQLRNDSARPWLLTVGTNLGRNEMRSLGRWRRAVGRIGAAPPVPDPADEVASRIDDERRMSELNRLVLTLPRAEREALALCVWSGVSYAEAAKTLNKGESSVRSLVSRGRARLARLLTESADDPRPAVSGVRNAEEPS
jgi:RNA polymerase sigma-70 factor (ECF subfamily)